MQPTKLRKRLTDTAIATAQRWQHPAVDRRHVLVALLAEGMLRDQADLVMLNVDALLDPSGTATDPPIIPPETDLLLLRCSDTASAFFTAQQLVEELMAQQSAPRPSPVAAPSPRPAADLPAPPPDLESVLARLDALVGLDAVKATVHRLIDLHRLNQARAARSLPVVPVSLHLVFTGNPGTGKTTVARVIADVYRALGILPNATLREVHRADLVAGYVGQTAANVQRVITDTLGGVLFIDEAYALASPSAEDFGSEAVATLVKLMEDHREQLAVIAAGYSREMEEFITSNSGLRSRFSRFIAFPDYTDHELLEIVRRMAADRQIVLSPTVAEAVLATIALASPELRNGNGRFARNLFERMYEHMAVRVNADQTISDPELLAGFAVEDVTLP